MQETGDRRQEIRDRRQEAGDKRQESGDRITTDYWYLIPTPDF
jgi:hypothetical protein